jgi:hypothetical protein
VPAITFVANPASNGTGHFPMSCRDTLEPHDLEDKSLVEAAKTEGLRDSEEGGGVGCPDCKACTHMREEP